MEWGSGLSRDRSSGRQIEMPEAGKRGNVNRMRGEGRQASCPLIWNMLYY